MLIFEIVPPSVAVLMALGGRRKLTHASNQGIPPCLASRGELSPQLQAVDSRSAKRRLTGWNAG